MTDENLISGAAAPAAERLIRSSVALDAIWVVCVAAALVVSSLIPLVDLEDVYVRTADAPLRAYTVALPVLATILAVVAAARRSALLAASATGVLVPAVAFAGSVAASLFFDVTSPFTDAGVPLTLAAGALGLVMLVRWFVYQPTPVPGRDPRPTRQSATALSLMGLALAAVVVVDAVRDDVPWSLPFALATALMMLTALVVVVAGLVRSTGANVLAAAACLAQFAAVVVVERDDADSGAVVLAESATTIRTGAVGLIVLVVAAALAIAGAVRPRLDVVEERSTTDDAAWRWSADEV